MRACSQVPEGQREQLSVPRTGETEEDNETAKKAPERVFPEAASRPGREGGYFPIPRRRAVLACGQNTGLPRSSRGLCLPSPCPSQEWSSEGFEALSRLSPSFQEGGEAAAEGSLGGPQAQALLAASLWYVSLGREAWSSSVSLPTTPGHLPSLGSWVLLGFDSGLFVPYQSQTLFI